LAFLTIVPFSGVLAEEALVGRVVSIDPDKGTVTVEPVGEEEELVVSLKDGVIPGGLTVGDLVRIWGTKDSVNGLFSASSLRTASGGFGHHTDPTGVRKRLGGRGYGSGGGFGGHGGRGGR
jgi:hypothetical protein